jgi:hypothetical protein
MLLKLILGLGDYRYIRNVKVSRGVVFNTRINKRVVLILQ